MHPIPSSLNQLLQRPDLWRARRHEPAEHDEPAPGTGFPQLDQALHAGGWPADGLVELLCRGACPTVLRLLLPVLADSGDGLVVLAGPPARPCLRTLRRAGLAPERLLVLHSRDSRMLLRACREAAASESASGMVIWLPPGRDDPGTLRRLHLAARQGRCRLFLMRDERQAEQPSPAPLRLLVRSCLPGDLEIEIHKQAGGRAGQRLRLAVLPEPLRTPMLAVARMPAPQQAWREDTPRPALRPTPRLPVPVYRRKGLPELPG